MEQELTAKTRRIAELEIELEQRIAREIRLEERLHQERDRSGELRDKLRRMNRRLEEIERASEDSDLDATREMVGQAIDATPIRFRNGHEKEDERAADRPRLLCLTSGVAEPYVMLKDAITIGRGSDCDIQIVTDFVSRQHATISRDNSETVIQDQSSTNGVFVNARRIEKEKLTDGDEIMIGESRFRFLGGDTTN
jgi:predicted component of type VI protein secretion system